jgi:hypothetical protein
LSSLPEECKEWVSLLNLVVDLHFPETLSESKLSGDAKKKQAIQLMVQIFTYNFFLILFQTTLIRNVAQKEKLLITIDNTQVSLFFFFKGQF